MDLVKYRMAIKGMTCEDCEATVTEALVSAGAQEVKVDRKRQTATFSASAGADARLFVQAVDAAGFSASVPVRIGYGTKAAHQGGVQTTDLIIIGSGSAGFAAAIRARELGAKVIMVEAGTLGGTCVNIGCVPSKALLHQAWLGRLKAGPVSPLDVEAFVAWKDRLVAELRNKKYEQLVAAYGWELIRGRARFLDSEHISVDGRTFRAERFLIATGATPWIPPIPGLTETPHLTSTTALDLMEVPSSVAVIGANAVGLELGQYFRLVGSDVVLLEAMPRIAPFEEPEISSVLEEALSKQGIKIATGAEITKVQPGRIFARVSGEEMVWKVDRILVATGRRPNTHGLDLDRAGIATDQRGALLVDSTLRSTNPRVWAAGDVTGGPQFVYVAAYEGKIAAENMLLDTVAQVDLTLVPRVTFTWPQVASVGLTEAQAKEAGHNIAISILPLEQVPRALVNQQTSGIVKLVADATSRRLLGAHIVAENAGDVIYAATIAIRLGATLSDITSTFAPYLTMAEALKLAAQGFEMDVSRLSCCAG
jgi:mercuric reductase